MTKFVIIITKGPYYGVATEWPLRFVHAAIKNGHQVTIILAEDAIFLAKKGQEQYIKAALDNGAIIKACQTCTVRRGLTVEKDFIEKVITGSMSDFVEACAQADKVLVF